VPEVGHIGLFLLSEGSPYQQMLLQEAQAAVTRYGLAMEVHWANGVGARQAQDVVRYVNERPGARFAVVMMPVTDVSTGEAAASPAESALGKLGRRVLSAAGAFVVLNRDADALVEALQVEFPAALVGSVSPNRKQIGRIQGEQARALAPKGGRVLLIIGNPTTTSAQDRRAGLLETLAGGGFSVEEVDGWWSQELAREAVYKWIVSPLRRGHALDLVVAQNDEMALGAIEALERASKELGRPELKRVRVTGADGLPETGQRWVSEHKLAATVVLPATTRHAVEQIAKAWQTGQPFPHRSVVLECRAHPSASALQP
jgi:hypothetical protein